MAHGVSVATPMRRWVAASAPEALTSGGWSSGVLIDIGSTFTKATVIDPAGQIVDHSHAATTIDDDVMTGVATVMGELGGGAFDWGLVSSSAAGGLRMAAVGITERLSGRAGTLAALGAGAKVVATEAGELDDGAVRRIAASAPHLVLLTGGTNGGNVDLLVRNAERLGSLPRVPGFVVAGNIAAADAAVTALQSASATDIRVVDNVFPAPGEVVVAPTREAVRELFMEHITRAKGLDGVLATFRSDCEPTPLAVSRAVQFLPHSQGEPVVLVDLGGATTDVHSAGGRQYRQRKVDLPLPEVMRTVEGDLGMRWSAPGALATLSDQRRAELSAGLDVDLVQEAYRRHRDPQLVPDSAAGRGVDLLLAEACIGVALERHAGRVVIRHHAWGDRHRVAGKDLRGARTLIGTGGIFRHTAEPRKLLGRGLAFARDAFVPTNPELIVDTNYTLYAIGLVARHDATLAQCMAAAVGQTSPQDMNRTTVEE